MKRKHFKIRNSFVFTCTKYLLIYSLILLIIYYGINYAINQKLDYIFPSIDVLLQYEDLLKSDNFADIPISKLKKCSYIVFDDEGRVIYASNSTISNKITYEDTFIINDFNDNVYYMIFENSGDSGTVTYSVSQVQYDIDGSDMIQIVNSCILDENYSVIEGNLFSDKGFLTSNEFDLIRGIFDKKAEIEKYEYSTNGGEARTLIFISPMFDQKTYEKVLYSTNAVWLMGIPLILLALLTEVLLFTRHIKKSITPLNDAISAHKDNSNLKIDALNIPKEFQSTADNFNKLMDRLSCVQAEKETMYQENQRIITDISHDLKTPLTVINGYANAFIEHKIPEGQQDKYLKIISNKAQLASELIDSLFNYIQMQHPDYEPAFEELDFGELIKSILAEKYSEIETLGFNMEVDIPDNPIKYNADKQLIRRLLENLLGNSLKYNSAGTTIYISLKIKKHNIILTVADDGVGISDEIAQQVFDPFVTKNSARTSGKGTGLGLSIVKRIVELHNGDIKLKTSPESLYSTAFVITFYA